MHILVVEDDDGVRRLAELVLTDAGHTVMSFSTAEDALQSRAQITAADIILTDARLPGMTGIELASRVRAMPRHPRIILMTGYTDDPQVTAAIRRLRLHIIEKPFTPEKLLTAVLAAQS